MRARLVIFATLCAFLAGSKASADPLYSTTDLGAGYTLNSAPDNSVNGLTAADGTAYAFDKSPISYIHETFYNSYGIDPRIPGQSDIPTMYLGVHTSAYMEYTVTDGIHKVGYLYDPVFGQPAAGPSFLGVGTAWHGVDVRLVSDFNIHGQAVGTSDLAGAASSASGTYAAFSAPNFTQHDFLSVEQASSGVDNLNNYIAPIPGVSLTSAFKIDDMGRILAQGSNGDTYLLTPVVLGQPAPVPEPGSVAIFGLAILALGYRSARRSR